MPIFLILFFLLTGCGSVSSVDDGPAPRLTDPFNLPNQDIDQRLIADFGQFRKIAREEGLGDSELEPLNRMVEAKIKVVLIPNIGEMKTFPSQAWGEIYTVAVSDDSKIEKLRSHIFFHELGHVLGWDHTSKKGELMSEGLSLVIQDTAGEALTREIKRRASDGSLLSLNGWLGDCELGD